MTYVIYLTIFSSSDLSLSLGLFLWLCIASDKIRWEVEYPEDDNQYIPFLDTEILIKDNGEISSRYYRKPRNKGITLNYQSHHQMGTKSAVAKNYYKTAREVSSGPMELQHSLNIVDSVLSQNGYPNPRSFDRLDDRTDKTRHGTSFSTLSLPYTTEKDANCIRNYMKSNEMPIRLVFTPGKTLKKILCKSRPYDTSTCVLGNPRDAPFVQSLLTVPVINGEQFTS